MKGQEKKQRALTFGKNVRFLREKADLTVAGLAAGIPLSENHLRKVEKGETNVRARTAKAIGNFFNTDTATLYAAEPPPVKDIEEMPAIKKFREANKNNYQFFTSLRRQNSVATFLREILLKKKKYFREERRDVANVVNECEGYKKNFDSKEVSRELIRLVERGTLDRRPKTDTEKRFWYFEPEQPFDPSVAK